MNNCFRKQSSLLLLLYILSYNNTASQYNNTTQYNNNNNQIVWLCLYQPTNHLTNANTQTMSQCAFDTVSIGRLSPTTT